MHIIKVRCDVGLDHPMVLDVYSSEVESWHPYAEAVMWYERNGFYRVPFALILRARRLLRWAHRFNGTADGHEWHKSQRRQP